MADNDEDSSFLDESTVDESDFDTVLLYSREHLNYHIVKQTQYLQQLESIYRETKKELVEAQEELEIARDEVAALHDELRKARKKYRSTEIAHRGEVEERHGLEKDITVFKQEIDDLNAKIKALEETIARLTKDNGELTKKNAELAKRPEPQDADDLKEAPVKILLGDLQSIQKIVYDIDRSVSDSMKESVYKGAHRLIKSFEKDMRKKYNIPPVKKGEKITNDQLVIALKALKDTTKGILSAETSSVQNMINRAANNVLKRLQNDIRTIYQQELAKHEAKTSGAKVASQEGDEPGESRRQSFGGQVDPQSTPLAASRLPRPQTENLQKSVRRSLTARNAASSSSSSSKSQIGSEERQGATTYFSRFPHFLEWTISFSINLTI